MSLKYQLDSVYLQYIGLPQDIRLFLEACYKVVNRSANVLTPENRRAMKKFVDSYPEDITKKFKEE